MTRAQLEHIIRASASIAQSDAIIVVGSQAILGQFPNPPAALTVSMEADVYPRDKPEAWNLIDGAIGEGSPFHETFGYYAQGVGPETATLAEGWRERLIRIESEDTRGAAGYCLSAVDLALSKLAANREKDRAFVQTMLSHALVTRADLLALLPRMPVSDAEMTRIAAALHA